MALAAAVAAALRGRGILVVSMFGTLRYVLAALVGVTHLGPASLRYIGYYAVLCFFTLSGCVLSAAYGRHYGGAEHAYARYYANRLLRVIPT